MTSPGFLICCSNNGQNLPQVAPGVLNHNLRKAAESKRLLFPSVALMSLLSKCYHETDRHCISARRGVLGKTHPQEHLLSPNYQEARSE